MRDSKAEFQFLDFAPSSRNPRPPTLVTARSAADSSPPSSKLRAKDWAWVARAICASRIPEGVALTVGYLLPLVLL